MRGRPAETFISRGRPKEAVLLFARGFAPLTRKTLGGDASRPRLHWSRMFVWRIPLVYFAVLTATIAVVMMLSFVIEARRRVASALLRGILTSSGIGVVASPALVNSMADTELRELSKLGVSAHQGFAVFVAPAVVAGMLLVVCYLH